MNPRGVTIEWNGETLALLPERAVWWARHSTLFIADPHFGKAAAFRFAGIPVPESSHDDDLERLSRILDKTGAQRLVILGDFLHARTGRSAGTMAALKQWRETHAALDIVLVIGNHDRHAGALPADWRFQCVTEPWALGPFLCRHEPMEEENAPVFAGHVHPSFRLSSRGGASLRAPCFHFGARLAVLPAFGSFTGTHSVQPLQGDRVFLVGPDSISETFHRRAQRQG